MAGSSRIRPATEADLPAIMDIERAVFSDPWSLESFRSLLADIMTVAQSQSAVVGYLVARHNADSGDIMNVAVHPDHRQQGIGRALVEDSLQRLAAVGVKTVSLGVRQSNAAAQRLYERMGFTVVGKTRGYYREPREDAVVMRISQSNVKY